jgi:hypothetical protein
MFGGYKLAPYIGLNKQDFIILPSAFPAGTHTGKRSVRTRQLVLND